MRFHPKYTYINSRSKLRFLPNLGWSRGLRVACCVPMPAFQQLLLLSTILTTSGMGVLPALGARSCRGERKVGEKGVCAEAAGSVQAERVTQGRSWSPCRWQVLPCPSCAGASPAMGCCCRSFPRVEQTQWGAPGSPSPGFCCQI